MINAKINKYYPLGSIAANIASNVNDNNNNNNNNNNDNNDNSANVNVQNNNNGSNNSNTLMVPVGKKRRRQFNVSFYSNIYLGLYTDFFHLI